MILGHADEILMPVKRMDKGLSFGAPTHIEIEMAEEVCKPDSVHGHGAHGELRAPKPP